MSLGVSHSAVLTRNGDLYTGGSKIDGQLGVKYIKPYSQGGSVNSSNGESNLMLNQYKDARELQDISLPLHKV